ncbi:MAG TPA: malonyl-ACP O-methyltransferase BioC [Rhodocyclaceae bacterium]|jgi:malonyl-CoA O-methyltransferase|nr:malonyl-ACP O-methyltransferase BioC [Rhodocyclaceae bacterium]
MIDLNLEGARIRSSFDRAASSYDQAAELQRRVADTLLRNFVFTNPHSIVDGGCGTGYGTAGLAARFPDAQLLGLDLAPGMLQATRQRLSHQSLVCADIQALPLSERSIDLLWSSLMLQWCNRLDLAFADIQRCLRAEGEFVFSTFGPATLHELRNSFSDGHTHVSRFIDAEAIKELLHTAGFIDVRTDTRTEILYYADAKSLMQELKAIGAHNATAGRARGLTGKRGWQMMLHNYEQHRSEAGLPASYEVIYVSARKAG